MSVTETNYIVSWMGVRRSLQSKFCLDMSPFDLKLKTLDYSGTRVMIIRVKSHALTTKPPLRPCLHWGYIHLGRHISSYCSLTS